MIDSIRKHISNGTLIWATEYGNWGNNSVIDIARSADGKSKNNNGISSVINKDRKWRNDAMTILINKGTRWTDCNLFLNINDNYSSER